MSLITKQDIKRFAEIGSQTESDDPIVVTKLSSPLGAISWYITEYNPYTNIALGYVTGLFETDKWDIFSMEELDTLKLNYLPYKLGIRRVSAFKETRFSKLGL